LFLALKQNNSLKKIAILASGSGSNAENISNYFENSSKGKVVLIGSNRKDAYVLERAKNLKIPSFIFSKTELEVGQVSEVLKNHQIDLIVLAGFLLKIPYNLIQDFPDQIVNIHPALLPKYGGKGMYGDFVHQAVKESGDPETGITIHWVNENYDEGAIIFQKSVNLSSADAPKDIAQKVHQLEYEHYPKVIESLL
jgi:phosphoribosylglycinamide formyltransferase-1